MEKVFVLAVSNSEGCCRPSIYDSKEKALKALQEAYDSEVDEWTDEDGNLVDDEEYGNPIEACYIDLEAGSATVTFHDNEVNFEVYEEEVK